MKLLVLVALLVVLLLVAYAVARGIEQRRVARGAWELDEVSDGEHVSVYAVHPAQERLLIGAVPFSAEDFDFRIEEVRSQGRFKLVALNGGRALSR